MLHVYHNIRSIKWANINTWWCVRVDCVDRYFPQQHAVVYFTDLFRLITALWSHITSACAARRAKHYKLLTFGDFSLLDRSLTLTSIKVLSNFYSGLDAPRSVSIASIYNKLFKFRPVYWDVNKLWVNTTNWNPNTANFPLRSTTPTCFFLKATSKCFFWSWRSENKSFRYSLIILVYFNSAF